MYNVCFELFISSFWKNRFNEMIMNLLNVLLCLYSMQQQIKSLLMTLVVLCLIPQKFKIIILRHLVWAKNLIWMPKRKTWIESQTQEPWSTASLFIQATPTGLSVQISEDCSERKVLQVFFTFKKCSMWNPM